MNNGHNGYGWVPSGKGRFQRASYEGAHVRGRLLRGRRAVPVRFNSGRTSRHAIFDFARLIEAEGRDTIYDFIDAMAAAELSK